MTDTSPNDTTKTIYGIAYAGTEGVSPPSQSNALVEAGEDETAVARLQHVDDGQSEYDVFVYYDTDGARDVEVIWTKRLKAVPFDQISVPVEMYEQVSYEEGRYE